MDNIEAFILIGGRSSRFGTDKALVELGNMTLAERAVMNVREALSPERITMVAGNSTQFAMQAIVAEVPFIFDLHEGRGPLGGLQAALAYARKPWVFVFACDYPFVSAELIRLLASRVDDRYGVVVPEQRDGRMQPLCGFYNVAAARPVVEEIIERPRAAPPMHEIATMLNPLIVKFEEYDDLAGADFLNINTVGELESARHRDESRDATTR